ncbi:MAG: cytochrome ubiquinol oxidase subunit I [Desulfobacterales bacterium]|nr:cytochrome ubiquinol oxidase subunit I [Desulfobacterales bacterium]
MDLVMLSRLQFAVATMFHFLFVPLTLGLSVLIAIMETKYVRTGDEIYLKMTKFWGKIFLINFAVGVVTGITLEFQFGTNWSRYSIYVGDIFGSILAIEATVAFFLESTFIGVWAFGWKKLSKKAHAFVIWLVAFGSMISGYWILVANAWMQHPVGYVIKNNRAELVDFFAIITQKLALLEFFHTIPAAFILSSFFVMSISAYHLLKKQNIDFFEKSFKLALVMGLIFSIVVIGTGDMSGVDVAHTQPAKLAAMESHWETKTYAPINLIAIPSEEEERNIIEFGEIPGILSFLAFHDFTAEVKGLKDIPKDERPPVLLTSIAFKGMVGLGSYFFLITLIGWFKRNKLIDSVKFLKIIMISLPLPYIAIELGWILTEVGRQPWIVYGLMKTKDAVSVSVSEIQVIASLIGFIVIYGLLGAIGFYLIFKNALKGPQNS